MKARLPALGAMLLSVVTPAAAHRVDEYLQATIIAVEKGRVRADMYLTPGLGVLPVVLADIDSDGNGVLSEGERRAYAERVLGDLSLTLNGERLMPRLVSLEFPPAEELKEGRGDIHLEFSADLPTKKPDRSLRLENRHYSRIAAYQVNCLVPTAQEIRISAEQRNYSQSVYELRFTQPDPRAGSPRLGSRLPFATGLVSGVLFLFAWVSFRWRQLDRTAMATRSFG